MKSLINDLVGLSGIGLTTAGVWLRFGIADALIYSGAVLLLGAVFTAWRARNAV